MKLKLTPEEFEEEQMFVPDIAKYCGFSSTRVRQLFESGKLKMYTQKASGKKYSLRRLLAEHKTPTSVRNKRMGMR